MGCGVCFFSLRIGLGSEFVVFSFGGAVGGFRSDAFVSFLVVFFSWGARDFFFPFFFLSIVVGV